MTREELNEMLAHVTDGIVTEGYTNDTGLFTTRLVEVVDRMPIGAKFTDGTNEDERGYAVFEKIDADTVSIHYPNDEYLDDEERSNSFGSSGLAAYWTMGFGEYLEDEDEFEELEDDEMIGTPCIPNGSLHFHLV